MSEAQFSEFIFRMDTYVGERDSFGIGLSDNVIFRKQYYLQATMDGPFAPFVHGSARHIGDRGPADRAELERLADAEDGSVRRATASPSGGWTFTTAGTGFTATWRVAVESEQGF